MSKARIWIVLVVGFCGIIVLVGLLWGLLVRRDQNDPWENIRLPTDLKPRHYDIKLVIDITNHAFNGTSTVLIECVETTNIILIHSKLMEIDTGTITLKKQDGGSAPGFSKVPWLYEENQYIVNELDGMLEAGSMYELSIVFSGPLLTGMTGIYRSSYVTESGETKWVASTQFQPTEARKAFPCFDEPAFKANFTLTIDNERDYLVLSNMPLDGGNVTLPSGWIRSKFQMSVPMSTYLLCFVVCDFVYIQKHTKGGVQLRIWARPEASGSLQYALDKGADIIDFYEDYFQITFPLPKMDMIAIPDFGPIAMENWGLITYVDTNLLVTQGVTAAKDKQQALQWIAHELAHQWFGNLVTLQWWDDLWLNEGFATYVQYLGMQHVEPTWGMMDQFVALDVQVALDVDALQTSRPISVDVATPDDITQQFDTISYSKGSSILRMLQNFLGEATFRKGLNTYLTEFAYSNAVNTDLWRHLTMAAHDDGKDIDVKTIMATWTQQMGFPVITVTRNSGSSIEFSASQERFLTNTESVEQTNYPKLGYKWYVPMTVTNAVSADFAGDVIEWMNPDEAFDKTLSAGNDSDWLLVNIGEYGYYRTNYDANNWDLISQQLEADHTIFPITNRAALISDVLNLARGGKLSHVAAFELMSYLVDERDYVPWVSVDYNMGYISLMLSRSDASGLFNTYRLSHVTPFYEYIGWDGRNTDHLSSLTQSLAVSLACSYGNQECINNATQEFAAWMADPNYNPIIPTLRSAVYCTAIANGRNEEWQFAFDQYRKTVDASEASTLISSLGCSDDVSVLESYLQMSLDPSQIRSQDTADVIINVAKNPVGYSLAWEFFSANWEFYLSTYSASLFAFKDLVEGVTAYFNKEVELNMLEDFMAKHPDQGSAQRTFDQSVEGTKANIRWMDSYLGEVTEWLDNVTRR